MKTPITLIRIGATALLAGALALAACVQTEPGNGGGTESSGISLTGRVVGTGSAPVAGVVVSLARSGVSDTTDALGRYTLSKSTAGTAEGMVLDTLRYSMKGQSLARVSVLQWIDTLPDVEVVQRDISGMLNDSGTTITRVEAVVTGDGIDSADPVVTEFYYSALTGNYSGFVYFPHAGTLQNYSVHVNIYGAGDLVIGRSQTVPFNSLAGNITVPAFGASNAVPVADAGADTAVGFGEAVQLHGSAVDSFGGTIAKYEWSIGGGAFVQTSTGDTTFSRSTHGVYAGILRVTDNDGNQALDTVLASVVSAGASWTTRASGTSATLTDVVWTGTQFVAVGAAGTVLTSPDGITWTTRSTGAPASLASIAWSGQKLFATTTSSSLGNTVYYTSVDGITWIPGTVPTAVAGMGGACKVSAMDSVVIIASQSSTSRYIARSTNHGASWVVDVLPQSNVAADGPIASVYAFTKHAGLIVGVGSNGLTASSPGDSVWTRHTSMESFPRPYGGVYDYTMLSVVSTGTHAVAVGYAGHVMRSTDGITWMQPRIAGTIPQQEGGSSSGDLYGVAWTGNTLVAVGYGYTVLSADGGANWTTVQTNTGFMRGVAWNGTRFVAVGNSGKIVSTP